MHVVCIYSGVAMFEQKLDYIFNIFKSTLEEIGVEVSVFDVSKLNINFFVGNKVPIIETIFNNMKNANGIIFATTAQRLAPNGAMQCFLEHMDKNLYGNILKDKTCISIVTSTDNSEYNAGNYMDTLISSFEATPINGMFVGNEYLENIEMSLETTQMIERYAEDFYRGFKQKRKYFVSSIFKKIEKQAEKQTEKLENNILFEKEESAFPSFKNNQNNPYFNEPIKTEDNKQIRTLAGSQVASLYQKEIENNVYSQQNKNLQPQNANSFNNIYTQQNNFNSDASNFQREYFPNKNTEKIQEFNSFQEDDINELSKLLSKKFKEESKRNADLNNLINRTGERRNYAENIVPNINSLKQKTQSLYHYFQPHIAKEFNFSMQVSISGKENFNGYFIINNGECTYTEGIYQNADVTIISDAYVWEEILSGKSTLQKAFMLGRLKVKGNFVMISKFEQIFKIL